MDDKMFMFEDNLKIIEDISTANLVVKDNFLIETKYNLSVIEQKIVLLLISQLDSMGDEKLRYFEFKSSNLLKYLSLGKGNYLYLKSMLKNLYKKEVLLKSENGKKEFWSRWISSVYYDSENGIIRLSLDPQLEPYLLNISKNFTRYPLHKILSLSNRYSIRLYEILKKHEKIRKLKISIIELKKIFQIEDKYKEFRDFKRDLLELAISEINEETELNISCEYTKESRKITGVIFKIGTKELMKNSLDSNETLLSDQMISLGLSYNKIQEFLKTHDKDRLERNIKHVQDEIEKNPNIKNIGGLLNVAIESDFAYLPPEVLKKKRAKEDKKQLEAEKRKRAKDLEGHIERIKEAIQEDKKKKFKKYLKNLSDEEIEKEKSLLWESDYFKKENEMVYGMGRGSKGGEMLLTFAYKEKIVSFEKKDLKRVMKKTCKEKEFYDDILKEFSKGE